MVWFSCQNFGPIMPILGNYADIIGEFLKRPNSHAHTQHLLRFCVKIMKKYPLSYCHLRLETLSHCVGLDNIPGQGI